MLAHAQKHRDHLRINRSKSAMRVVYALASIGALACTSPLLRSVEPGGGGTAPGGDDTTAGRGGANVYPRPGIGFLSAARLGALQNAVRSNDPTVPWNALHGECEQLVSSSPHPHASYYPGSGYSDTGPVVNPAGLQVQNDFYQDSRTAYTEALCFRLSPDSTRARIYASTAERVVGAWVTQGFTDVSTNSDVNLVFAGGFSAMTMAADLLAADVTWDPRPYRAYLLRVALAHNDPYASVTNHSAWETMLRAVVGAYIDDDAMVDSMRQRWLFLADTQVAPDGSLRFEICRSNTQNWCGDPHMGINGLLYSNYDLAPMAVAGEVFGHRGVSVWGTSAGAKMGAAYATTAYWTLNPQASPYYAHNNGQIAAPAPPTFYAIFQRHYSNASGAAVYAQNAAKWWGTPYWTEVIYAVNVAD